MVSKDVPQTTIKLAWLAKQKLRDHTTSHDVIAYKKDAAGICKEIGADGLVYQDLKDLIRAVNEGNKNITKFICLIFIQL